jgi:hypothetical protein
VPALLAPGAETRGFDNFFACLDKVMILQLFGAHDGLKGSIDRFLRRVAHSSTEVNAHFRLAHFNGTVQANGMHLYLKILKIFNDIKTFDGDAACGLFVPFDLATRFDAFLQEIKEFLTIFNQIFFIIGSAQSHGRYLIVLVPLDGRHNADEGFVIVGRFLFRHTSTPLKWLRHPMVSKIKQRKSSFHTPFRRRAPGYAAPVSGKHEPGP